MKSAKQNKNCLMILAAEYTLEQCVHIGTDTPWTAKPSHPANITKA